MVGICGKPEEQEDEFPEMTVKKKKKKKASSDGDHPQERGE